MTRLGAAFWVGLVMASGFATFKVKYAVQEIEDQLTRTRKQAVAEQQEIRVLAAEWTYLNQPDRLATLNAALLQLAPLTAKQLQRRIEDIAWRAPAVLPDLLLAANAPAATPLPGSAPPAAAMPAAAPVLAAAPATATPAAAASAAPPPVAAAGPAPAREGPASAAAALAEAVRVLGASGGSPGASPKVRLAKAAPASLDALIARIADTR